MKDYRYPFEKLNVWQKTRVLVALVYEITRHFPIDERFGLTSQMRRAAISILSNIAEGTSRTSKREQARFTEMAYSSATELLAQSIVASDLNFIEEPAYLDIREKITEITAMLASLRNYQSNELHEPEAFYNNS